MGKKNDGYESHSVNGEPIGDGQAASWSPMVAWNWTQAEDTGQSWRSATGWETPTPTSDQGRVAELEAERSYCEQAMNDPRQNKEARKAAEARIAAINRELLGIRKHNTTVR